MPRRGSVQEQPRPGATHASYGTADDADRQPLLDSDLSPQPYHHSQEEHHYHDDYDDDDDENEFAQQAARASSVRSSDVGIPLHDHPSASIGQTIVVVVASIVGVAVLAMGVALAKTSLGIGIFLIVLCHFCAVFASYTLTVASEYMGVYSEAQILCLVLCRMGGSGSNDAMELKRLRRLKQRLTQEQQHNRGELSNNSGSRREQQQQQQPQNNNCNNSNNIVKSFFSESSDLESFSEHDLQYLDALENAEASRQQVNLFIDILLAVSYWLYLVTYAKVISDSMKSVCSDFSAPPWLQDERTWLITGSVVFFFLSARRVFQELAITSFIAVATIVFVLICIVIKFGLAMKNGEAAIQQNQQESSSGISGGDNNNNNNNRVNFWTIEFENFASGFCTFTGAYAYHVMHSAFYQELGQPRTPARMQVVVHSALSFSTACYFTCGIFGLLLFGEAVMSKSAGGNIINNFTSSSSATDTLMLIARLVLVVHFCMVYPLVLSAVRLCLHRALLRLTGHHHRADDPDEIFRVSYPVILCEVAGIVATSVVVAAVVPSIATIVSLTGCLGGNFSMLIAPGCLFLMYRELSEREAKTQEKNDGKTRRQRQQNGPAAADAGEHDDDDDDDEYDRLPELLEKRSNNNFFALRTSSKNKNTKVDQEKEDDDRDEDESDDDAEQGVKQFCVMTLSHDVSFYLCIGLIVIGCVSAVAGIWSNLKEF